MEDISLFYPPPSRTVSNSHAPYSGFLFPHPKQMTPARQSRSFGSSSRNSARTLSPSVTYSNRHVPYSDFFSPSSRQMPLGRDPGSIGSYPQHSVTPSPPLPGGGCTETKKWNRLTMGQTRILMDVFARTQRPDNHLQNELASRLNIAVRGIQAWFKNRRAIVKWNMESGTSSPSEISSVGGYEVISYGNLPRTANRSYTYPDPTTRVADPERPSPLLIESNPTSMDPKPSATTASTGLNLDTDLFDPFQIAEENLRRAFSGLTVTRRQENA